MRSQCGCTVMSKVKKENELSIKLMDLGAKRLKILLETAVYSVNIQDMHGLIYQTQYIW